MSLQDNTVSRGTQLTSISLGLSDHLGLLGGPSAQAKLEQPIIILEEPWPSYAKRPHNLSSNYFPLPSWRWWWWHPRLQQSLTLWDATRMLLTSKSLFDSDSQDQRQHTNSFRLGAESSDITWESESPSTRLQTYEQLVFPGYLVLLQIWRTRSSLNNCNLSRKGPVRCHSAFLLQLKYKEFQTRDTSTEKWAFTPRVFTVHSCESMEDTPSSSNG